MQPSAWHRAVGATEAVQHILRAGRGNAKDGSATEASASPCVAAFRRRRVERAHYVDQARARVRSVAPACEAVQHPLLMSRRNAENGSVRDGAPLYKLNRCFAAVHLPNEYSLFGVPRFFCKRRCIAAIAAGREIIPSS
jgi:hypothetical protein